MKTTDKKITKKKIKIYIYSMIVILIKSKKNMVKLN